MNSDWLGPLFYSSCSTSVMDRTIQYCYDAAEELCYGQDYSVLLWCCRGALLWTGLFSIAMMLQRSSVMDRTIQYCYDAAEELCYGQDSSVLLWYCRGALLWTGLFSIAMMLQRSSVMDRIIQYCYDAAEELVNQLKLVFNWEMALGEGPIYRTKEWTERRGTSMWMVSQWWSVSPTLVNSENLSHWPILHGTKVKHDLFYKRQKKYKTAH